MTRGAHDSPIAPRGYSRTWPRTRPASISRITASLVFLAFAGCFRPFQNAPTPVDVNNASVDAIARLPGLTSADAERIVASRPYYTKDDLVRRGVLTAEQYARSKDMLVVGKPGMPDYLKWVPPEP